MPAPGSLPASVQNNVNEDVVDDLGGNLHEQNFSRDDYTLEAICYGR